VRANLISKLWICLDHGSWVPHISLVFREMWDSTSLDRSPSRTKQAQLNAFIYGMASIPKSASPFAGKAHQIRV